MDVLGDDVLEKLLKQLEAREIDRDTVLQYIRKMPYEDLGFVKIDYHRGLRQGFPEVIYCASKTAEQVKEIFRRLAERSAGF